MAGLARFKKHGKQLGRHRVGPEMERNIRAALKAGTGIVSTSRELGIDHP